MRPTILIIGAALIASVACAEFRAHDRPDQEQRDPVALADGQAATVVMVAARLEPLVGIHAEVTAVERTDVLVGRLVSPPAPGFSAKFPIASTSGGMPG